MSSTFVISIFQVATQIQWVLDYLLAATTFNSTLRGAKDEEVDVSRSNDISLINYQIIVFGS